MENLKIGENEKVLCLDEMVDMLNQVSDSEEGSITIESEGILSIPMTVYTRSEQCDWKVVVNSKIKDDMIYEKLVIMDYNMTVDNFCFDTLRIMGDITWNSGLSEFRFSLGEDIDIVITVYDYMFDCDRFYDEELDEMCRCSYEYI